MTKKTKKYSPIFLLTKRNLKIFFSEKMSVFGSAIAPLIVLLLFLLFLKNVQVKALESMLNAVPDFTYEKSDLSTFINSWLISGVLCTSMITVPLGASTCLCNDNVKNMNLVFSTSPVKPYKITFSYFIMVYLVSLMIVLLLLAIGLAFVCGVSKSWVGWTNFIGIISVVIVFLLGSTFITVFFVSFIKSVAMFQVVNIVVGTTCGFIIGAYIPVSQFPDFIQSFCNIFPASSGTALIKTFLVENYLVKFANGNDTVSDLLKTYFSCELKFANTVITNLGQWIYLGIFPIVTIPLNVWRFTIMNKIKS